MSSAPTASKTLPDLTSGGQRREPGSSGSGRDTYRFKQTLKDARAGLIEAQYQVGLMHATGSGTRKNLAEALAWTTRAAERGHAGAQYRLGCHFAPEPGTAPRGQLDEARAMDWLYLASRQGHARAHHRLAQLLRQAGPALGAHHEAAAASLGLAESQRALARQQLPPFADAELHSSGRAWLRRAAEQGLAAAQAELGVLCLDQGSSPESDEEGWRWLRAAAQQAWPPALLELHCRGEKTPDLPQPVQDPIEPAARHAVGLLFEMGLAGLRANPQQARHWYAQAAAQNWPQAHTALGRISEAREPEAAVQHYRQGAEAGDTAAQHALWRLLRDPARGAEDQLQARRWLAQAADAGHAEALLDLSDLLTSTEPDLAESALLRAAETGLAEAQFRLARRYLASKTAVQQRDARHWLECAADQGHLAAKGTLALALRSGQGGKADPSRGLALLQEAAEAGDAASAWNLGLLLAGGAADIPRDLAAALACCRRAADSGFVPAMASMGVLCASTERPEEAVHWWRLAAQAGDLEAQYNLAKALAAGRGEARNDRLAFDWMLQAAEAGLAQAQLELGVMYASGQGVACDAVEAHKWFTAARLAGSTAAARNAERSAQLLSPAQAEEAQRRARAWRQRHKRHD